MYRKVYISAATTEVTLQTSYDECMPTAAENPTITIGAYSIRIDDERDKIVHTEATMITEEAYQDWSHCTPVSAAYIAFMAAVKSIQAMDLPQHSKFVILTDCRAAVKIVEKCLEMQGGTPSYWTNPYRYESPDLLVRYLVALAKLGQSDITVDHIIQSGGRKEKKPSLPGPLKPYLLETQVKTLKAMHTSLGEKLKMASKTLEQCIKS